MALLAVRLIDLAIFGSLGALWIGGAVFIVVLYRWLLRFERDNEPHTPDALPVPVSGMVEEPAAAAPAPRPSPRMRPQTATAREALAAQP